MATETCGSIAMHIEVLTDNKEQQTLKMKSVNSDEKTLEVMKKENTKKLADMLEIVEKGNKLDFERWIKQK